MKAISLILAGGFGLAALASAAPAAAQYYPGYPAPGYGYPGTGYNNNVVGQVLGQILGYGRYPYGNYGYQQYGNQSMAVDQCARAVEARVMMQGLLAARGYFTHDTPAERELRARITKLWEGVDWDWFRATPKRDALYWHWSPNYGWYIHFRLEGWNEVMITYLLAVASPII